MGLPNSFCQLVQLLYTDPEVRIKVNGHYSKSFSPLNGVKQGCPLSPLLYILAMQPFLALLEHSSAFTGIPVPGPKGQGERSLKALAYADDLLLFLRSYDQLPIFYDLMRIYELASGAKINWQKTHGLLLGTFRIGASAPVSLLRIARVCPPLRVIQWTDVDSDYAVRYLGIYLGSEPATPHKCGQNGLRVALLYASTPCALREALVLGMGALPS